MILRGIILLAIIAYSLQSYAFSCYFTLVKDSCWTNYDVKVTVKDASTNQDMLTIVVPKGKSWNRVPFSCQPAQSFSYEAVFQPTFWQGEARDSYKSLKFVSLPKAINEDVAWDVPVCYPQDFSAVPFPPTAGGNCACDFKSVPSIKN